MWRELPYKTWRETYDTLHMMTQIVGKVALKLNPVINHWWECSLRVSSRGLRTPPIRYEHHYLGIEFDFIDHKLVISKSDGAVRVIGLSQRSVAEFYHEFMDCLDSIGVKVEIDRVPSEVPNPIAFNEDQLHHTYDREFAFRHWQILCETDKVLTQFRSQFLGKASPVQFWWGSFDLVVSFFSGRVAPSRINADHMTKEAYSHEVFSCGFWPGSGNILEPAFYAYITPEPKGFKDAELKPHAAFYNNDTQGFILKYEDVRNLANPAACVLDFFQSAYDLGADLAGWDRKNLEREKKPAIEVDPPGPITANLLL